MRTLIGRAHAWLIRRRCDHGKTVSDVELALMREGKLPIARPTVKGESKKGTFNPLTNRKRPDYILRPAVIRKLAA